MKVVLAMVLAGLVALPLSVSAQPAEEDSLSSWQVEAKPAPEPAPEKPALELKLDDAGIQVMESPPPAVDGYPRRIQIIDEPMDPRVKRARIGFLVSTGVACAGFVLTMIGLGGALSGGEIIGGDTPDPDWAEPAAVAGGVVFGAGVVGMITAGGIWGHRTRQLRKGLGNVSDSRTPRRVQWDLAQSRLVF